MDSTELNVIAKDVHARHFAHDVDLAKWAIRVATAEEMTDECAGERSRLKMGWCRWREGEIWVRDDLDEATARQTLVHEFCHAACGDAEGSDLSENGGHTIRWLRRLEAARDPKEDDPNGWNWVDTEISEFRWIYSLWLDANHPTLRRRVDDLVAAKIGNQVFHLNPTRNVTEQMLSQLEWKDPFSAYREEWHSVEDYFTYELEWKPRESRLLRDLRGCGS